MCERSLTFGQAMIDKLMTAASWQSLEMYRHRGLLDTWSSGGWGGCSSFERLKSKT